MTIFEQIIANERKLQHLAEVFSALNLKIVQITHGKRLGIEVVGREAE